MKLWWLGLLSAGDASETRPRTVLLAGRWQRRRSIRSW